MLSRLKRPGYWIVLLAILTVYAYRQFTREEAHQRTESLLAVYRSYGEMFFDDLRSRRLFQVQNRFGEEESRELDLEKIALFIDTLHLDRATGTQWQSLKQKGQELELGGRIDLEGNRSYPVNMILVRRGGDILLKGVTVGGRELRPDREGFPVELPSPLFEANHSTPTP